MKYDVIAYCWNDALAGFTREDAQRLTHVNLAFGLLKDGLLDLHLLAAAGTARVSTTAAAGKLLMEYGVLLCADEEKLLDGARKQAADLWRRVNA